uniref:Secreted protein n=1 Tax=Steinernema glaseri TaxID=37863 RepID=A0A1I8AA68_9BILA
MFAANQQSAPTHFSTQRFFIFLKQFLLIVALEHPISQFFSFFRAIGLSRRRATRPHTALCLQKEGEEEHDGRQPSLSPHCRCCCFQPKMQAPGRIACRDKCHLLGLLVRSSSRWLLVASIWKRRAATDTRVESESERAKALSL